MKQRERVDLERSNLALQREKRKASEDCVGECEKRFKKLEENQERLEKKMQENHEKLDEKMDTLIAGKFARVISVRQNSFKIKHLQ